MEIIQRKSAEELVRESRELGGIHVECNHETAKELFQQVRQLEGKYRIGYVLHTDKGYERESVKRYLNFWRQLHGFGEPVEEVLKRFGLENIAHKRLGRLGVGERMLVQLARVSLQNAEVIFLEEPLLNLESGGMEKVLRWIGESYEAGIYFITANASMRHALLMPGSAFYCKDGIFCQVEQEEVIQEDEDELYVLKLAAKSGGSTLLFEPKDIDFVESLNKCNYISVRGTLFQISQTMDEVEEMLRKSGFFRCHRSYIVNMQRVEQIEKISRNSFVLLLDDKEKSRIPLSKGRVEEMRNTCRWSAETAAPFILRITPFVAKQALLVLGGLCSSRNGCIAESVVIR